MFSEKWILCWHQIFNSLPSSLKSLGIEKAQFKVALRRHLNTHSFHSVDYIFMFNDPQYCMWNLYSICTVIILYVWHILDILYIYDLFHILLSFWETRGSMEYTYCHSINVKVLRQNHLLLGFQLDASQTTRQLHYHHCQWWVTAPQQCWL